MGKQGGDRSRATQELDDLVYTVVLDADGMISAAQVTMMVNRSSTNKIKSYSNIAKSLVRLTSANLIIKKQAGKTRQNMFAVAGGEIIDLEYVKPIDNHPLSNCWPYKVHVPRGTPRKPHRCPIDGE